MFRPDSANFQMVAIDAEDVARRYDEVGDRAVHAQPAFDRIVDIMEETHSRHFARLKGRYVLTGATMRSLTQSNANGAIREAHQGGLNFGTFVEQAHYLTKAPRDPNSGQVRKVNGEGKYAVLVFSRRTKERVADVLLDHMTEKFG